MDNKPIKADWGWWIWGSIFCAIIGGCVYLNDRSERQRSEQFWRNHSPQEVQQMLDQTRRNIKKMDREQREGKRGADERYWDADRDKWPI